jgi:hypothetical protein
VKVVIKLFTRIILILHGFMNVKWAWAKRSNAFQGEMVVAQAAHSVISFAFMQRHNPRNMLYVPMTRLTARIRLPSKPFLVPRQPNHVSAYYQICPAEESFDGWPGMCIPIQGQWRQP